MVYTCVCYCGDYNDFLDYLQRYIKHYENTEEKIEFGINVQSKRNISTVVKELLKLDKIYLSVCVNALCINNIPKEIFELNIKEMTLYNFTENVPSDISNFVNLEKLTIMNGSINFPNICNLKNLTNIDFYQTNIIDKIPFEITKLQQLQNVFINFKPLIFYDIQNLKKANFERIKNKHLQYRLYYLICKSNNNKIINKFIKTSRLKVFINLLKCTYDKEEEYYDSDDEYEED